jgi:hypothetical protein
MATLRRFWFPVLGRMGIGVTAFDLGEATRMANEVRDRLFPLSPELDDVIEDVDVSTLDERHVVPNMGPVVVRGVWYPRLGS